MISPGLLPEGLRDRLPPQAEATAALVRRLTATFAAHGYERVQPPLVEYEESLGSRLGGAARRELLRFTDPARSGVSPSPAWPARRGRCG